jgi:hypothetical protein
MFCNMMIYTVVGENRMCGQRRFPRNFNQLTKLLGSFRGRRAAIRKQVDHQSENLYDHTINRNSWIGWCCSPYIAPGSWLN